MKRRAPGYKRPPTVAAWKSQVKAAHEAGDTAKLMHLAMSRPPGVELDPDLVSEARLMRVLNGEGVT